MVSLAKSVKIGLISGLAALVLNCGNDKLENRKFSYLSPSDAINALDSDRDYIPNVVEDVYGLDKYDADTDDDGLLDGNEGLSYFNAPSLTSSSGRVINTEYGTDPLSYDTDGDGLGDGVEFGLTSSEYPPHTKNFIGDEDPLTISNPLNPDSDGDGLLDGEEDSNLNGRYDLNETDNNNIDSNNDGFTDGYGIAVHPLNPNDNTPPLAEYTATPSQGNAPLEVSFDSTGSFDPESGIAEYHWDFNNDMVVDSNEKNPIYTYNASGIYNPTLIVTNGSGLYASSRSLEVIVGEHINSPPVASNIPDISFNEDATYSLNLNDYVSDSDNLDSEISWVASGNTNISINILNGIATLTPTANWNGMETLTFTAYDLEGLSDSDSTIVTVSPVNDAPIANAGLDKIIMEGNPIRFDGSGSYDLDGIINSYNWNFGDGVIVDGQNVIHTYMQDGTYTATLTVTDNFGDSSSDSAIITVEDNPILFEDNFEDGVTDPSLWVVGGGKRCVGNPGGGSWQYWNEEIIDTIDGYLQARTAGPSSGATCGGEAWTRTLHDFNDGLDYVVNFKWETGILGPLYWDRHGIQITDGFNNWNGSVYDVWAERPGTYDLYHTFETDTSPQDWSILIDNTLKTAELYEGPDGTGTLHSSISLDPAYPWHIRFMTSDATSSGFPGGEVIINLYSFQAKKR